ncbi:glycosyltransferase [Anaerostipes faecalis]|uniref:glycosyltransferase n=1 Tax=Anaerostipes faecalis TaxID=2738446 RepID=UPI003F07DFFF
MKKKILFINGHMNSGGVEKSLLDILCHIDFHKFSVELLLLEDLGDYYEEVPREIKVRLFDLHNTYGNIWICIIRCIRLKDWKCLWVRIVFLFTKYFGKEKLRWIGKTIVGNQEYDCVVGFRPGIVSELAAYSVKSRNKITWWHHGEFNLDEKQARDYLNVCKKMNQIVVVSNGCRQFLIEKFPNLKEKMQVIPNMLDIRRIQKKANAYIPFQKEKGKLDLVTVGRLSPEKHLENVVYAAKYLINIGKDNFRWFIVGEGEEREYLEKLIQDKHLCNYVILVGNKVNPYPYMKCADLVIHTSYVESQCLVVLEAMALGKVCVVTESVGPKEFAVDGENCLLAKQDLESLEKSIEKAMEDRQNFESYKMAATDTAELYSVEKVMLKIQELLIK